jgi:hypothetical protein
MPVSDDFARTLFEKGARTKKKQPQWFMKLAQAVRDVNITIRQAKRPLSTMQGGGFITTLAATVLPGLISYGVNAIRKKYAAKKKKKLPGGR